MANSTFRGRCVAPFLEEQLFPTVGGYVDARLCTRVVTIPGEPTCCLPCPATDWLYTDNFKTQNAAAEWLNVMGFVLLLFMLLSYMILPVSKTRAHYLSTCLVLSIMMVCIGFIIPLAAKPDQCYNEITPHDMYSSLECAWSGAFLVAGGLCTTMWITIRALSMNLQICWDIVPGRKFLYAAMIIGWGLPAALFAATMAVTGVSFRFGNACHVNHKNAIGVFWGPLLGIVAIAGIAQLWTFAYCVRVYLKNLWGADAPGNSTAKSNSSGLPTYNSSLRVQTTRAVFNRLKKVLFLQWRGLGIVSIILVDVIFFSIVFVHVDKLAEDALSDFIKTEKWILCLVAHPTNKSACESLVTTWLVNVETIEAVLFLFALAGLQCFLMMTRPTFFTAWYDLFREKSSRRQEFVSLDAENHTTMHDAKMHTVHTTFEMQKPKKSSEETERVENKEYILSSGLSSPDETYRSPFLRGDNVDRQPGMSPPVEPTASPPTAAATGWNRNEYFTQRQNIDSRGNSTIQNERHYNAPVRSFSGLRTPSRHSSMTARSGLGLLDSTRDAHAEQDLRPGSQWKQ